MYHGRIVGIIEKQEFTKRKYGFIEKRDLMKKFIMDKWVPNNNGDRTPTENERYSLHVKQCSNDGLCCNIVVKNTEELNLIQNAPYTEFVMRCEVLCVGEIIDHVYSDSETEMLRDLDYLYDEIMTNDYIQSKYPLGIAVVYESR